MKKIVISLVFLFTVILTSRAQCEESYGTIVISEVYFDSRFNEDIHDKYHSFGEYIELYNSSTQDIDLTNWEIRDNHTSYKFNTQDGQNNSSNLIIAAGGFKIITYNGFYAREYGQGYSSLIGGREKFLELFPIQNGGEDIILQNKMVLFNETDKLSLYNPSGRLVSEMSYLNESTQKLDPLVYLNMPSFTKIINPAIDNSSGGIFNGPIGMFSLYIDADPIGYYVDQQTSLYQDALYLSDEANYYTNGGMNYEVGIASPMALPNGINILPKPLDPFIFLPPDSIVENYTESFSYNVKTGALEAHSRNYFDDLARATVSLSKDFSTDLVWGIESLYDSSGKPFQQSFPTVSCFDFKKVNFLSNSTIRTNFLEKFYSNNNNFEAYQATASQPFIQTNYDILNPGNVINVVGGNQINNEWKTGYSFTVPAAQEMYYAYGYNHFDGPFDTADPTKEEVITKFFKTISIDANGIENVVFTDGEGKTLATARSGGQNGYPVYSLIGTQGFVDVYLPQGITTAPTFLTSVQDYTIFDLKTGLQLSSPNSMVPGNAYRIVANTIPSVDPKVYISNVASGGTLSTSSGAKGILHDVNYYDYAINVYDKTDRLKRTIQPKAYANEIGTGIPTIKDAPNYMSPTATAFVSSVSYTTLGQVEQSTSSDEGISKFAYRSDGQIRYSQSALQALPDAQNQIKISYTNYDSYGRPIESGVISAPSSVDLWNDAKANVDNNDVTNNILYAYPLSERVFTVYDYAENQDDVTLQLPQSLSLSTIAANEGIAPFYFQKNLGGGVVATYKAETGNTIDAITWYSYDIYGRSEWVIRYTPDLGAKTIDYVYDDQGNVEQVLYQQHNTAELFVHRYTYDLNGTVTKVETKSGSNAFVVDAEYSYYKTGELKRTNIGQGLQGLDYVYTLGGMLKSINHPSLDPVNDPGKDGFQDANNPNATVAPDLFGISLDYYQGDYNRSGTNIVSSPTVAPDYTGNIKASRWANRNLDTVQGNIVQKAYSYQYNRDNWITDATFGTADSSGNLTLSPNSNHKEYGLQYDPNGNIQSLLRTDDSGALVDHLDYDYNPNNNQLNSVIDTGSSTPTDPSDLEGTSNYLYNVIGQLTNSSPDGLEYFYNTRGLTTEVRKNGHSVVRFFYNERGHRIKKESYQTSGSYLLESTDYYVFDLSGSVLSIYHQPASSGTITQQEMPIYGTSRLGVYYKASNDRSYQITDHLGNVRAVVRRIPNSPYVAMISYADYYPFGEQLKGRNSLNNYRYAYQGQEKDTETGMEAFQLRLWDGRIGRWLSPDPYGQNFSPYVGMGNNPARMIDPDGGWCFDYNGNIIPCGDGFEMYDNFLFHETILDEVMVTNPYGPKNIAKPIDNNDNGFYHTFFSNPTNADWGITVMNAGYKYQSGLFDFKAEYNMFNIAANGIAESTLLAGDVSVSGGDLTVSTGYGGDNWRIGGSANGQVFAADASGGIGVYTGQDGKRGVILGVSGGAAAIRGDLEGDFTVGGIHIVPSIGGSVGSVEGGIGGKVIHDEKTNKVEIDLHLRGAIIAGGRINFHISF